MRALVFGIAAAAGVVACTPEVVPGSYLCGPEESCPEGQACNGSDELCVLSFNADQFRCDEDTHDTIDQAAPMPSFECVSAPYIAHDCLAKADGQDWFAFHVRPVCTSAADIRLTFPIAFEPLTFDVWTGGSMLAQSGACEVVPAPGFDAACVTLPVNPDADYAIVVKPAGGGDCGGKCNYNRYDLQVQLSTR
jgi:hypothetical protein